VQSLEDVRGPLPSQVVTDLSARCKKIIKKQFAIHRDAIYYAPRVGSKGWTNRQKLSRDEVDRVGELASAQQEMLCELAFRWFPFGRNH
jgi:hypothetical protein